MIANASRSGALASHSACMMAFENSITQLTPREVRASTISYCSGALRAKRAAKRERLRGPEGETSGQAVFNLEVARTCHGLISGSKGRLGSRGALVVLWKWAAAFQTQG